MSRRSLVGLKKEAVHYFNETLKNKTVNIQKFGKITAP